MKLGHQVDLFSTNGVQYFPTDLKPYLIGHSEEASPQVYGLTPGKDYDMNFSYTALKNFPVNLSHSNKNRFGCWAWEWSGINSLPTGFAKYHQQTDYVVSPSNYCKKIFQDSGIPENKLITIPHGIDFDELNSAEPIKLNTDKIKICVNIGQCHMRKGIDLTLEAYGKAFSKKDNVCFIIKVSEKEPTAPFEVSFKEELIKFSKKYPNHAEIKIIREFIPNIYSLYKACDIYFHLTRCEGFGMPFAEALFSGMSVVAPRHGGQLDFLNDDNSTLIGGTETFAPPKSLY
jgi:glycosyltransferase involved in cell wall biosynthesis